MQKTAMSRPEKPVDKKILRLKVGGPEYGNGNGHLGVWNVRAFQSPLRPCFKQVGIPGTPSNPGNNKGNTNPVVNSRKLANPVVNSRKLADPVVNPESKLSPQIEAA